MAKETVVTPWEVKGDIDYDRLIKEFGISHFKDIPSPFKENIIYRRKTVFAQRDIEPVFDCVRNKKPFVMMTGLMPSGKFHLGHMILAQQMILWQDAGARIYIAVADIESYNSRDQSLEDSRKIAIEEYILNYIALGLKPKNCRIYFQSDRAKDSRKSNAFYRLQNILARHATFNEFKAVYGEISPGKMISAMIQAADMLHPQLPEFEGKMPVVVPVGIDQDPHLRLARDMSSRVKAYSFNKLSSTYHKFMPGLGGGKMSSSDINSYIALTDSPKEAENKIKKYAFSGGQATIEEHRKKGGNPDVDVSFQYLNNFFEENDGRLKKIHDDYASGKMLTGELKQILAEKIRGFLEAHKEKREKASGRIDEFIGRE